MDKDADSPGLGQSLTVESGTESTGEPTMRSPARLARARATLLYFEGTPFQFSHVRISAVLPLQVTDTSGRVLGAATLDRLHDRLDAIIRFDYSSPERLEMECNELYAHPDAHLHLPSAYLPTSYYTPPGELPEVDLISFNRIVLSIMRPPDPRTGRLEPLP